MIEGVTVCMYVFDGRRLRCCQCNVYTELDS